MEKSSSSSVTAINSSNDRNDGSTAQRLSGSAAQRLNRSQSVQRQKRRPNAVARTRHQSPAHVAIDRRRRPPSRGRREQSPPLAPRGRQFPRQASSPPRAIPLARRPATPGRCQQGRRNPLRPHRARQTHRARTLFTHPHRPRLRLPLQRLQRRHRAHEDPRRETSRGVEAMKYWCYYTDVVRYLERLEALYSQKKTEGPAYLIWQDDDGPSMIAGPGIEWHRGDGPPPDIDAINLTARQRPSNRAAAARLRSTSRPNSQDRAPQRNTASPQCRQRAASATAPGVARGQGKITRPCCRTYS